MGIIFIQSIYIIINLVIGLYDFSFYRIPNALLGALLVLYAVYAPFFVSFDTLMGALMVSGIVLVITFTLFAVKIIGGGDAKYLTVTSLWVGTAGIMPFVLIFSFLGGLLAIIYLMFRDHIQRLSDLIWLRIQKYEKQFAGLQYIWSGSGKGPELGERENIGARMLPYGIAIATAAIIMIVNNPLTD